MPGIINNDKPNSHKKINLFPISPIHPRITNSKVEEAFQRKTKDSDRKEETSVKKSGPFFKSRSVKSLFKRILPSKYKAKSKNSEPSEESKKGSTPKTIKELDPPLEIYSPPVPGHLLRVLALHNNFHPIGVNTPLRQPRQEVCSRPTNPTLGQP